MRVFSFAQESTRYCNYSKDKFGNELTFIIPSWEDIDEEDANSFVNLALWGKLNDEGEKFILYYTTLQEIEATYLKMLKDGFKPQQARQILPNALKTEIVMTGFVSDWKHFFDLRCAPNAHPDMKHLADKLKEEFISRRYM